MRVPLDNASSRIASLYENAHISRDRRFGRPTLAVPAKQRVGLGESGDRQLCRNWLHCLLHLQIFQRE